MRGVAVDVIVGARISSTGCCGATGCVPEGFATVGAVVCVSIGIGCIGTAEAVVCALAVVFVIVFFFLHCTFLYVRSIFPLFLR